jgi:hypothetical protein
LYFTRIFYSFFFTKQKYLSETEEEQQMYREENPDWVATWDPDWGDRMTELVFIDVGMNQAAFG